MKCSRKRRQPERDGLVRQCMLGQERATAEAAGKAMSASSSDPFGAKRFERSRAKTPYGYKRLFDKVSRELIGIPLTRKQRREIRAQRPKLAASEIDKNAYRHPVVRERTPRDMPKRRAPGWVACNFLLPRITLEGLTFLTKSMSAPARKPAQNKLPNSRMTPSST